MRVERLERSRADAELGAPKAQIDPHLLFNSLNTLDHLIAHDARRGREFCDTFAEVYRYVLASRSRDLVPLSDELDFVRSYHRLLALRFGSAIALELDEKLADGDAGTLARPAACIADPGRECRQAQPARRRCAARGHLAHRRRGSAREQCGEPAQVIDYLLKRSTKAGSPTHLRNTRG